MITRSEKFRAKYISILIWDWLIRHPRRHNKLGLFGLEYYKDLIKNEYAGCALCTLYRCDDNNCCPGCPLDTDNMNCLAGLSEYHIWYDPKTVLPRRAQAAQNIFESILNWDIDAEE
jgi:hypothetical protein